MLFNQHWLALGSIIKPIAVDMEKRFLDCLMHQVQGELASF